MIHSRPPYSFDITKKMYAKLFGLSKMIKKSFMLNVNKSLYICSEVYILKNYLPEEGWRG